MIMLKVKIRNVERHSGYAFKAHFEKRPYHILIHLAMDSAYVLDDSNQIRVVPVGHVEVISLESVSHKTEKLVTLGELTEQQNKKGDNKPDHPSHTPDVVEGNPVVKAKVPASHEERGVTEDSKTGELSTNEPQPKDGDKGQEGDDGQPE